MSLAQGNVHPDVYEVELFLSYRLNGFFDYSNSQKYVLETIGDYIKSEVYDIGDMDIIDLDWTVEVCDKTPRFNYNSWDIAGNMRVKAYVHDVSSEKVAINTVKHALREQFIPCSGTLTITWNGWMDVAEGAAA